MSSLAVTTHGRRATRRWCHQSRRSCSVRRPSRPLPVAVAFVRKETTNDTGGRQVGAIVVCHIVSSSLSLLVSSAGGHKIRGSKEHWNKKTIIEVWVGTCDPLRRGSRSSAAPPLRNSTQCTRGGADVQHPRSWLQEDPDPVRRVVRTHLKFTTLGTKYHARYTTQVEPPANRMPLSG